MPPAPLPQNETERLTALLALKLLDTEASREFDIFPLLASRLFGVPIAAISLLDQDRQWFKARVGLSVDETPRDSSFCAHAILEPDGLLLVPDATLDPRFAQNPLVTGELGLRFYAGATIYGPEGHALGAICVIDRQPRDIDPAALEQLQELALAVSGALKLHAKMQELQSQAVTDPLTGLNNRIGLDRALAAALARRSQGGARSNVGLLRLDLDGFRDVNDLFSHAGGDLVLQEVARRLRLVTRPGDTLARIGGDEFCVLLDGVLDAVLVGGVAERIQEAVADPCVLERQVVKLRASIGMALSPADAADADSLMQAADVALHEAKRAGGGVVHRYSAVSECGPNRAAGRSAIRAMLREALLPHGQEPFALALQPIFNAQAGQALTGFEALVRWPLPDGRVMQPGEFIPVAESTGMVVQLDHWVLDRACALASGWPEHLAISSNLSAANFFSGDLVADVGAALDRHGLAPHRLKLEITETVMLRDPEHVRSVITGLRRLGVRVILDDFGAGHASISYLRDYEFDGLKIDRSFINRVETDGRSRAFVQAIVSLVRALGIETTAEGIETEGQLHMLRRKGVSLLQGYLLGRPMGVDAASSLIRTWWPPPPPSVLQPADGTGSAAFDRVRV